MDPVPAGAGGVGQPRVDGALVTAVREEHRLDLDDHPAGPVGAGRARRRAEQALRAGVGREQLRRAAAERVPDQVRRVAGAAAGEVADQVLVRAPVLRRGGGGVAVPGDVGDGLRRVLLVGRRVVAEVVDLGTGQPQVRHALSSGRRTDVIAGIGRFGLRFDPNGAIRGNEPPTLARPFGSVMGIRPRVRNGRPLRAPPDPCSAVPRRKPERLGKAVGRGRIPSRRSRPVNR